MVPKPQLHRPGYLRAGFSAEVNDPGGSGLVHAGEQWAAAKFMIASHTHEVWEWYIQIHGVTRWKVNDKTWVVRPGDLLGVSPGVVHSMTEESSANVHFYFAALEFSPILARHPALARALPPPSGAIYRTGASDLIDPLAQMVNELTEHQDHLAVGLTLATDRFGLALARILQSSRKTRAIAGHPAVQHVQTLLDREYHLPWTLEKLAYRVGLAPTYLAALFAAEVGVPPHRYFTERRINRAKQLLTSSDLSITAVGLEVGFGSGQQFARIFRQVVGTTPRDYRSKGHQ